VDTCTVAALDAITAFAVPNPNCSSQSKSVFSGLAAFSVARQADHSAYFGLAKFYLSQPFQPSTEANLNSCFMDVNAFLISVSYICGCFVEKQGQSRKSQQQHAEEPIECLDGGK
jgi:hypothetical protein